MSSPPSARSTLKRRAACTRLLCDTSSAAHLPAFTGPAARKKVPGALQQGPSENLKPGALNQGRLSQIAFQKHCLFSPQIRGLGAVLPFSFAEQEAGTCYPACLLRQKKNTAPLSGALHTGTNTAYYAGNDFLYHFSFHVFSRFMHPLHQKFISIITVLSQKNIFSKSAFFIFNGRNTSPEHIFLFLLKYHNRSGAKKFFWK